MTDVRFTQTNSALAMTCRIEATISAPADIVWRLLTDAQGFPRWNSTVSAIEGEIRDGERIRIHAPGTKLTFTPMISGVEPQRRMVWSDGVEPIFRGARRFELEPDGADATRFVMEERFSGVMFALARSMMPDFRPIFEAYANDLKREAERIVAGS